MSFIHFSSIAYFQASLRFYKERQRGELPEKEMLLQQIAWYEMPKIVSIFLTKCDNSCEFKNHDIKSIPLCRDISTTLPLFQRVLKMSYYALSTHCRNERLSVITSGLKKIFQSHAYHQQEVMVKRILCTLTQVFCYFQVLIKFENILPVFQRKYL